MRSPQIAIAVMALSFATCGDGKTQNTEPAPQETELAAERANPAAEKIDPTADKAKSTPPTSAPGSDKIDVSAGEPSGSIGQAPKDKPAPVEAQPVIVLNANGRKKTPVTFPHKLHADPETNPAVNGQCNLCHHEPSNDNPNPSCKIANCHDNRTVGVLVSMKAFHMLCRDGCHKQTRDAQPNNEKLRKVKACVGCHSG